MIHMSNRRILTFLACFVWGIAAGSMLGGLSLAGLTVSILGAVVITLASRHFFGDK
jgi:hypothetical protein